VIDLTDRLPYVQRRHRGRGVSLLVPFRADTEDREDIWEWLADYYAYHLPAARIIVGTDHGVPFSKASALNDAYSRTEDDVVVLLDADGYADWRVIEHCAHRIREARLIGRRSWYVPYRRLVRLTRAATLELLDSDPRHHWRKPEWFEVANAGDDGCYEGTDQGHHYGAVIMVMPTEAYAEVGGMDLRFRGWGSEDISFLLALDTLYARHRTLDTTMVTASHVTLGEKHHRRWVGQERADVNGRLGQRYSEAWGDPVRMRRLVDEGLGIVDYDQDRWLDDGGSA
jgi:hypothetical protein